MTCIPDARIRPLKNTIKLVIACIVIYMVKQRVPHSNCCKPCLPTWVRISCSEECSDNNLSNTAWFSTTIGYGAVYSLQEILSANETAYAMIASLIASDVPRQIGWHLAGARRLGATVEEVTAVRKMSMEVATRAGIQWREGVPDLENIDL